MDLLSAAPSVSHLTFGVNQAMTITSTAPGGGRLTLDNGSGPVAVIVSGSGQAIDGHVAVTLDSDAWITTGGSSDSLSIAASIGNGTAAHGIVKDGLGTLILWATTPTAAARRLMTGPWKSAARRHCLRERA